MGWVTFDTSDKCVWERVRFGAGVERLDYDDLKDEDELTGKTMGLK